MTLTAKQACFVKEYVRCLNGTQAAIAAGYSARTARAIASENLGKPSIREEIAKQERLQQERLNAAQQYMIDELVRIIDFDIAHLFDDAGGVLPILRWPPEAVSVVASFKCAPVRGNKNHARTSLKFHDRLKVLKRLGEIIGTFNRRKNAKRKPALR